MDPRAVPLPVRSRRSETKCLRHCYSAPGCPLAAALWSIPQVREPTRVARNPLFCSEPIQHHRHQDTFYLPQELLPDPFKETHQHDTVLTKMSPGTYLRDVLHDFFNFIVVCSSAQMTPFIMFWWLELNMVFCYHNDEDSKFGSFFFNFFLVVGGQLVAKEYSKAALHPHILAAPKDMVPIFNLKQTTCEFKIQPKHFTYFPTIKICI